MRRHTLLPLAAAGFSLIPASMMAQHAPGGAAPAPRPDMNNPNSRPDQSQNRSDAQKVDDKRFVEDAAMNGLTQVALGKLAAEKGSSDAVKQFGQKIVDDHTKSNDEVKQIATAGGLNFPDALDAKHQSRIDKLAKLSGTEFDKAYIKDQLKFHQQNVKEFQQEAESGNVVEVKTFASKALPELQEHLKLAKDLNKNKK